MTETDCRPYICPFPDPATARKGDRWLCPRCGAEYTLSAKKPRRRWWRNWSAPNGEWRLTFTTALRMRHRLQPRNYP